MARPKMKGKVRLNLELSAATHELLERLIVRAQAETRTEVIRNALRVYDAILDIQEGGGETVVKRKGGKPMLLRLI